MLRNFSDDKISDRFITGRNSERERILNKFTIEENSYIYNINDIYMTPHCHSQKKTREINPIDDEKAGQKIYLNLLKSQIFESKHYYML